MFKCSKDSGALYHNFQITLQNVFDIQVLHDESNFVCNNKPIKIFKCQTFVYSNGFNAMQTIEPVAFYEILADLRLHNRVLF